MDEACLQATARYVEPNPARAHLTGRDDALVQVAPLLRRILDRARFLAGGMTADEIEQIRKHSRTGRPLGAKRFVERLERRLGQPLLPRKPGRKPKEENQDRGN